MAIAVQPMKKTKKSRSSNNGGGGISASNTVPKKLNIESETDSDNMKMFVRKVRTRVKKKKNQ